jgi:hypothetical protein
MPMRQGDRLTGDEFQQLATRYFRSNKRWFASHIDTMNGKDVLNKFKQMLDFLKEESHEFKPVHQLRS